MPYRSDFKLQTNIPIIYGVEFSASLYSSPVVSQSFATNAGATASPLGAFAGYVEGFKMVNWTVSSTTRYPADCNCSTPGALVDPNLAQGSETIELIAPGSRLTPRLNQFDIGIRKIFRIKDRYTLEPEAQIFNVVNASTLLQETYALGTTIKPYVAGGPGGTPSVILNPRMLRLNLQFKF